MPKIKASEYSKISQAHSRATSDLKSIFQIEHLPEELKKEVQALHKKFEEYDLEKHRKAGTMLTGNIMTPDELKQLVVDATGYTRWKLDKNDDDDDFKEDYSYLLKHYGVDVANKGLIVEHRFVRNTNSRDELWLIKFTCLPGYVRISFDTGRVGWGAEGLIPNKDIQKIIEENFEG